MRLITVLKNIKNLFKKIIEGCVSNIKIIKGKILFYQIKNILKELCRDGIIEYEDGSIKFRLKNFYFVAFISDILLEEDNITIYMRKETYPSFNYDYLEFGIVDDKLDGFIPDDKIKVKSKIDFLKRLIYFIIY